MASHATGTGSVCALALDGSTGPSAAALTKPAMSTHRFNWGTGYCHGPDADHFEGDVEAFCGGFAGREARSAIFFEETATCYKPAARGMAAAQDLLSHQGVAELVDALDLG